MSFSVPAMQVGIMFGVMALGWISYKVNWIGTEALKGMTNLLIYLVAPAVIVQAFQRPFELAQLRTIGIVFLVDVGVFAVTIAIAHLVFNRRLIADPDSRISLRFGTVYSNAGFIGIPLTQALLGSEGVFYAVTFIAAFTVFVWTHGISLFGQAKESLSKRLRRVVLNPGIISILVALAFYVLSIHIPSPFADVIGYVGSMNTPLSMLVVGINLAMFSLRSVFSSGLAWLGMIARNLLVPAAFVLLLWPLPINHVAKMAVLISVAAPVGAFIVILSVRHDRDAQFPTKLLCLSTLVSVLTIPTVLVAGSALWGPG